MNTNRDRYNRCLVWQGHINGVGQKLVKTWSAFQLLQLFSNTSPKMSPDGIKCHQNFIGLSSENDHQNTTEIPPRMSADECEWVQFRIGANRCESVRVLTDSGTKMRANECKCGQKIGSNRVKSGRKSKLICDQMLPNATKNNPLTYQHLILLNNLFMFCVGQKLL